MPKNPKLLQFCASGLNWNCKEEIGTEFTLPGIVLGTIGTVVKKTGKNL